MTLFGAEITTSQFMPTFKVKGQSNHKADSLLPIPHSQKKFQQMCFISDGNDELNARCRTITETKRYIVSKLQELLHYKNNFVRLFKTAIDVMPPRTHKNITHADEKPAEEHA